MDFLSPLPPTLDAWVDACLPNPYKVDQVLLPGSGRISRTFRLQPRAVARVLLLDAPLAHGKTITTTTTTTATTTSTTMAGEDTKRLSSTARSQNNVMDWWRELQELRHLSDNSTWKHVSVYRIWHASTPNRPPQSQQLLLLVRPYVATTLSDRLASRPFLTEAEKLFIYFQLLQALQELHSHNIVHGVVHVNNVGMTSTGWITLLDVGLPHRHVPLLINDPTRYRQYFSSPERKRCYLAPERFLSKTTESIQHDNHAHDNTTTPAMDLFALGCVLSDMMGHNALELGQVLNHYQQNIQNNNREEDNQHPQTWQPLHAIQGLIPATDPKWVRQALASLWHPDPAQRLSAKQHVQRLVDSGMFTNNADGTILTKLHDLAGQVATSQPDQRILLLVQAYEEVLWDCHGSRPQRSWLAAATNTADNTDDTDTRRSSDHRDQDECLLQDTLALLRRLESLDSEEDQEPSREMKIDVEGHLLTTKQEEDRPKANQDIFLVYVQLVLSCVRQVQRPASKLVALHLIEQISFVVDDEIRLQRIVPYMVSILHDQDALVRARALGVLSRCLSKIQEFTPSDSNVFEQYIFKRITPLLSDASLVVRLAFVDNMAFFAEVAQRFLDIKHAVRIYEAIGNGSDDGVSSSNDNAAVFHNDVTSLLDEGSKNQYAQTEPVTTAPSSGASQRDFVGKVLIRSTYRTELDSLHEIVARWIAQVAMDQSEHAGMPKRALLSRLKHLCAFFGLEGVMKFILPQILTFLNEKLDWELRRALFQSLPEACRIIGRGATEEFVLPCLEIGLVDTTEPVVSSAQECIAKLIDNMLLSRTILLGKSMSKTGLGLVNRYLPLVLHPSSSIRRATTNVIISSYRGMPPADYHAFILPVLRTFLRFSPREEHMQSCDDLMPCLIKPWSREHYSVKIREGLDSLQGMSASGWTSIEIGKRDKVLEASADAFRADKERQADVAFSSYLYTLLKHTVSAGSVDKMVRGSRLANGIEGSSKLAQKVMFPTQSASSSKVHLPVWYKDLREQLRNDNVPKNEAAAIQSVSALGHVFGLSITGPEGGSEDVAVGTADDETAQSVVLSNNFLSDNKYTDADAAFRGCWGAEVSLAPDVVDTSMLAIKLTALRVPPLPPAMGEINVGSVQGKGGGSAKDGNTHEHWRPSINTLLSTSSPSRGHTAPVVKLAVSLDNQFFVSASYDGACKVWDSSFTVESSGIMQSSVAYRGHEPDMNVRVNDVAMVEHSHSIVSAYSDGSVHTWRVDLVESMSQQKSTVGDDVSRRKTSKVAGASEIRRVHPNEKEIMCVSQFNTNSSSVILYATQKGKVHSWDLRADKEPFVLSQGPDLGFLTSMAMGNDRQWLVTGTSRGYMALWDIRYQKAVRLWKQSGNGPIRRLATSFTPPPTTWKRGPQEESRPYIFSASIGDECSMYDVQTGACHQCFRTVGALTGITAENAQLPLLTEVPMRSQLEHGYLSAKATSSDRGAKSLSDPSVNCMVGSVGASPHSFLITGETSGHVRFWDFSVPSKCFTICGPSCTVKSRCTVERVDFGSSRLMLLRHVDGPRPDGSHGIQYADKHHTDSILDVKLLGPDKLLTCSRDTTIKVWG